ncbi:WDFY3 [Lepeophtheirus salmonis]|uniref:WDFY3 n=1 Tax=Lepeophtheirus salmonis TaxID=72036 RepID=A0A7R8HB69_LEPSM|nr:WDFY3 [Lepeophtheirus salmonis]CAF2969200.1 WDFY3 [Lepeophtheirus salmonis]
MILSKKSFSFCLKKNETPSIPIRIRSACIVLRMMYDTALGKYEIRRPNLPSSLGLADEDINNKDDEKGSRKRIAHLNLQPVPPDPVIVHPAVVSSILKLIPYMSLAEEEDVSDIEKEYVSMTTPRDSHIQNNSILPPFIEFDMSPEGFGCLFAPSIAPMSPHTSSVTSGASSAVVASFQQESSVIGGVGDGDRPFPCQPGLTYSTWICIDKFSDPKADPHPVRLLTIARSFRNSAGEEEHSVCLSVVLSSRDKALLISTKESPLPLINNSGTNFSNNSGKEQMPEGESGARIWFPDLIKEGEWHHLVLVFNRQTLKNSSFTLFVNGQKVAAQKMNYIGTYPGSQSNVTHATSVFGFIGTPPVWRRHSRLCWKQGPCLLFEDIASPSLASLLYKLGPHYLGSLQAPQISGDVMGSQVLEEKIILGINAVAMSSMTLNKIKKVYSKMDNKSIAKQLGMASGENATPIRIAHNSGSHLMGPARSLGGVVIGYLGVRVFTPQPVSKVIQTVGGSNVLLGIIAMATDMESLYAGVKALSCVLKSNPFARYEMEINKGYQILAMLLGRKKDLLNLHILHLVLTLAGTLDIGSQRTSEGSIPNVPAFKDVLCDLELWHEPAELEKSLFEHFLELVSDNRVGVTENVRQLREFSLVEKILRILKNLSGSLDKKLRRFSDKTDEDFQKIDLDAIWIYNFGVPAMESTSEKVVLSVDGICTILSLIRNLLDQNDLPDWLDQHATTLTQFLFYLYHNVADAQRAFMTEDVLNKCAEAMFPLKSDEPPEDEFISIHPSKRNLMNFMRILIVDSLSIQSTPKNSPVLDVLLDAKPDNISYSLHYRFQTELLGIVMDHLLAADVLIGGDSQFSKRRSSAIFSLEGIYRSLNRCILFMLSRENINRPEIRDLISQILCNRSLIFGAGNHELDFFGGLSYCLIQISYNKNICLNGSATESKTTWHVEFSTEPCSPESLEEELKEDCSKIWEELYVTKKPALEEVFKTSFGQQNTTPSLVSVKSQIYDASLKVWNSYIDAESKGLYPKIPAWEFHTQLQSKLQRVTGGLTGGLKRLTSVNGPLSSTLDYPNLPLKQQTLAHISVVINVVDQHYKNRAQTEAHMLKFIEEEWIVSEGRLTQERGLWGPYNENCLTKWMIDMTEGPFRMRKKLVRNENFFRDYPYREIFPESDETKTKNSKIWHDLHRPRNEDDDDQKLNVDEYDDCDIIVGSYEESLSIDEQMKRVGIYQGIKPVNNALESSVEENQSPSEDHSTPIINSGSPLVQVPDEEESSDYQTVMRLLEDGENITHMFRCARIQGLDTAEGLLLFGKEHFYILDGFTLVNGREVHDIEYIPDYEPIIPVVPGQVVVVSKREVFKVSYDNVKEVHKRRYLLQPIAVEVFSCDGQNKLLSFTKASRPKVYHRFLSAATSISDSASASVAGQKRSANVEQSSGIFSSMIGETSVTQRWVRGEITNFQYLMALNTLAGRSYNDLMQYPVFPWVLSDYKSDELDLSNPKSFRNLSKPMGAQTDHRLEQFMRRYSEWEDPHTDSPPYHYGTHYSSAMIVSSYMVRCEPFTQHFLHLQGGHFDLPDRMFHSVEEAWDSASRNNMADVRELIPEFFYLPDLFVNHNHFELGTKQNGQVLDDVILPPWAKGSPEEFIRLHREALESDYVSTHLHEWIDLIFGFKQSGPSAIESINVFHHLFYEGSVDIFAIEDPLQRNATIGFINNFGQIPKNLFKKPHPSKKINSDGFSGNGPLSTSSSSFSGNMGVFFHNLTNLRPSTSPIKELKGPVGQIVHGERVYVVEHNKVLVPGNLNRYLAWGNNDQSFRLCNYESDKAIFICEPNYLIGQVLSCVMPNSKTVITAGTSSVIAVYEYLKKFRQLHIKKLLYGHTDAVTCLTASPSWNIAVSGSRDRTAIVWDLSRYAYVKHLVGHIGPIAAVAINELTGDIITTSGSWLYLWDINGRLHASVDTTSSSSKMVCQQILCVTCSEYKEWDRENVIITGSSDGVVRMWSLDYVEVPFIKDSPKKQCRQSKLTTESNEDFVLVEEAGLSIRGKATKICNDGYIWKKGLVLRAKLTMHTAFERPDNVDPAAVTALAISKDHKIVYVGDEKGRVFSWTVSSRPGKEMVDHWWKDEGVESCVDCGVKFTIYERRHHCRNCGKVFCSSCSQYQAEIPRLKIMHPVRVCSCINMYVRYTYNVVICFAEGLFPVNIDSNESTYFSIFLLLSFFT